MADPADWTEATVGVLIGRIAVLGVAALAVVTDTGDVPHTLVQSMKELRVPLLTVPIRTSWTGLAQAVATEWAESQRRDVTWRDWLFGQLRPAPGGRQLARVVRWLAAQTNSRVSLIGSDHVLLAAAPQGAAKALPALAEEIRQVASGTPQSAGFEEGGTRVRLIAVGSGHPRAVLVLIRDSPFDRTINSIISRTTDLIAVHLALEETDARRRSRQDADAALRAAILQLFMVGEADKGRKVATSLFPGGQFDYEVARLYVLEGRPDGRDALLEECQSLVGGRALVVPCSKFDERLIVVAPQLCTTGGDGREVADALKAMVAGTSHRYLGKSDVRPLVETPQMYRHALRALAGARLDRSRTAVYDQHGRLPELLNDLWPGWSRAVLAPLLEEPEPERDLLLQALSRTLHSSVREAAELIGAHRNTVAHRVKAAVAILNVNIDSIRDRAVVAVALEAFALEEWHGDVPAPAAADLRDYLVGPEARAWADDLLSPLPMELAEPVKEWVLADGDTARMAAALGVHPQTARKRLRAATQYLQRDLLGNAADAYDVVLAVAYRFGLPVPLCRHCP